MKMFKTPKGRVYHIYENCKMQNSTFPFLVNTPKALCYEEKDIKLMLRTEICHWCRNQYEQQQQWNPEFARELKREEKKERESIRALDGQDQMVPVSHSDGFEW